MGALWPVNGTFSGRQLRQTIGAVWSGKTSARPLGARSGVVVGTPGSILSTTSTTWTVTPHAGVLDVETNAIAGPYSYSFDSNQTGSVNAAHATLDRIDLLSVQMGDTGEGDASTVGPTVVYTAGTAASSPVAPATPSRAFALGQIAVPHSGGGAPTITFVAQYVVAAGGILRCQSSTYYPSSPYFGQYIDDATLGLLRWDGSAWKQQTFFKIYAEGDGLVTIPLGSQVATGTVSFGTTFPTAPRVRVQCTTIGNHAINVQAVTTTGFTARPFRTPGDNAGSNQDVTFYWWAAQ